VSPAKRYYPWIASNSTRNEINSDCGDDDDDDDDDDCGWQEQ